MRTPCAVAIVHSHEEPEYFIPVCDPDSLNDFMAEHEVNLKDVVFLLFERHIDANEFMGGKLVVNRDAALSYHSAVACARQHEQAFDRSVNDLEFAYY